MIGEYTCPFYHNSGKVCGKSCMRAEGCSYHWKAKKRVPCNDCEKPTRSISGCCPLHTRGFYVAQHYNRLRSNTNAQTRDTQKRPYREIINIIKVMLANIREKTYEEIMDVHRDKLTNLNITLCREYLYPINIEEGEYCNNCQPGPLL
ncbi:hypothetical protein Glove_187g135 [Diversispora epigaea]|uniref:Uncharacterized protein n=1 Tax=Diversispora epigaea TaxID=1348612 RepID=A0A397IWB0_9GLOM|nr:hypothetical protein Glove_187g135 [Diversispora epigaea]